MNQPMELPEAFYDALAPLFDLITDWDARLAAEGPCLRYWLESQGARRVLDAACGSGGHALALALWGYEVTGADISQTMISLAQGKARAAGLDIPFVIADLAHLPAHLGRVAPFDAVLCLGNSLPHLLTQDALVAALRGMADLLPPGGMLITQNLNYDLRWRTRQRSLAAQGGIWNGDEYLVWRFADYDLVSGHIAFHIAVFRKGEAGWSVQEHTTPQRPLLHKDLLAALAEAGFGEAQSFGRLALPSSAFNSDASSDLVLVAWKESK